MVYACDCGLNVEAEHVHLSWYLPLFRICGLSIFETLTDHPVAVYRLTKKSSSQ